MIKYRLGCSKGHEFEAWFGSIAAYDQQAANEQVMCPVCGVTQIEKRPTAAAVHGTRTSSRSKAAQIEHIPATYDPAPAHGKASEIIAEMRKLKKKLLENSENVGPRFAEEARKIHFGDAPVRAVHGEATLGDAHQLAEDGVPFGMVPKLPEDHN